MSNFNALFMVNYIVDDMDLRLAERRSAGVPVNEQSSATITETSAG